MKHNRRIFLRDAALLGGAITLRGLASERQVPEGSQSFPASAEPEIAGGASVRQQFQTPSRKYGPIARWWWPSNNVTNLELRREINLFADAGFGGAEIQPFIVTSSDPKVRETSEWFAPARSTDSSRSLHCAR